MTSAPRSAPLFAAHAAALAGSPLFRGAGADAVRAKVASLGVPVKKGVFGADMQIMQLNDGPVTILYDCV